MKLDSSPQLDFSDVLIRPKRTTLTSRSQVNISREFKFPHSSIELSVTPIIAANMDTTGTFEVHKVLSKYDLITCMNKFYTIEDYKDNFNCLANPNLFMISTGISDDNFVKMCEIVDFTRCNWICIDIANGYMQRLVDFCRKVREKYPNKIIVAGNVATREMVEELIINGKVDVVKVGIGPGSACLTRLKTGVGVPQLSAIIECADAAHGVGGCIIGDGGITCPGDMSKAFCGGADFVMMGGVFSGHDENPGEIKEENGIKYKMFYGMSSELAMKKHYGKMEKYRSSEGRELKVKYKGSLINTLLDYLGGVRSTCTYINARKIKYMPKCTTFLLVSKQLNTHLVK
jgi:GMP reductase